MKRGHVLTALLAGAAGLVISAVAQEPQRGAASVSSAAVTETSTSAENSKPTHDSTLPKRGEKPKPKGAGASERLEGEERFRTNCGRCHQPPHKFAPRVMATAIRHMRVRAMITDEDMRLILRYMTE